MASAVQVVQGQHDRRPTACAREQEAAKKPRRSRPPQGMLDLADKFEASVGGVVKRGHRRRRRTAGDGADRCRRPPRKPRGSRMSLRPRPKQMTQNVQTVASATEELSSSIHEIGNQVTEIDAASSAAP